MFEINTYVVLKDNWVDIAREKIKDEIFKHWLEYGVINEINKNINKKLKIKDKTGNVYLLENEDGLVDGFAYDEKWLIECP